MPGEANRSSICNEKIEEVRDAAERTGAYISTTFVDL